jgi:hypothetical protein
VSKCGSFIAYADADTLHRREQFKKKYIDDKFDEFQRLHRILSKAERTHLENRYEIFLMNAIGTLKWLWTHLKKLSSRGELRQQLAKAQDVIKRQVW